MWACLLQQAVLVAADNQYYYRLRWGSYCVAVSNPGSPLGSLVEMRTCDYVTPQINNLQLWVYTIGHGWSWSQNSNLCMHATDGPLDANKSVDLQGCTSDFFYFDQLGGAYVTLVNQSQYQCLRANPVDGAALSTTTCNTGDRQTFEYLLGPATAPTGFVTGIGCFNSPSGFTYLSGTTSSSDNCAIAASAAQCAYYGTTAGECVCTNTTPTIGATACGLCSLPNIWQLCGASGSVGFFYQTPTCATGCVSCSSPIQCAQCSANYILRNGGCYALGGSLQCISGGRDSAVNYLNTVECWDQSARIWRVEPTLQLSAGVAYQVPFVFNGTSCLAGGGPNAVSTVVCANLSSYTVPSWTTFPSFPAARYGMAVIYPNDTAASLLLMGGEDVSNTVLLTSYQLVGTNWSTGGPMANQRTTAAAAFRGGRWEIYGGLSLSNSPTLLIEYWTGTRTINALNTLVTAVSNAYFFQYNGKWCLGGGTGQAGQLQTVQCMNTTDGSWSTDSLLIPTSATGGQYASFSLDGIQCIGDIAGVWCLSGSSWVTYPVMNTPRRNYAAFTYGPSTIPFLTPPTLSPTRSPTQSPTPSPTRSPTVSPASPSWAPSSSPTTTVTMPPTAADEIVWSVDYPHVLSASSWAIFTITTALPASCSIQWQFPTLPQSVANTAILNSTVAQLPPLSFPIGLQNFTITVTSSRGTSSSQSYWFSMVSSPLVVQIRGADRDVPVNTVIRLQAESLDATSLAAANQRIPYMFTYVWTLLSPCSAPTSSSGANFSITTGSQVQNCTATVSVSDISGRTATATGVLRVRNDLQFSVDISGDNPTPFPPSATLRLLGTVQPFPTTTITNYNYRWVVTPPLPTSCSVSLSSRALVIAPPCLEEVTNYTFTFTASDSTLVTTQSSAWIPLTTGTQPVTGTCTVTPSSGRALTTPFTVNCTVQINPGTPSLSYTLERLVSSEGVTQQMTLSLSQYEPEFTGLYLNLADPTVSQETVTMLVQATSGAGDISILTIPGLVLLPVSQTCPSLGLNSTAANDVQYLTALVAAMVPPSTAMNSCSTAELQRVWDLLWALVQQMGGLPFIDDRVVELVSSASNALVQASPPLVHVVLPPNFSTIIGQLLIQLINSPEATVNSTEVLLGAVEIALPSLSLSSCSLVDQILTALTARIRQTTAEFLPGESSLLTSGGGSTDISVSQSTFFGDSDGSLGSLSLNLSTALLAKGGDVSQIVVTNYQSAIEACRIPTGQGVLVGPVVDITLSPGGDGQAVSVNGVANGFSFLLPYLQDATCGKSQCVWWDVTTSTWRSDGCTGAETASGAAMVCTCTHLTEFSLLLDPGCVSKAYRGVYLALMAVYILLECIISAKLVYRLTAGLSSERRNTLTSPKVPMCSSLVVQHTLVLILAAARIASCALLSSNSRVRVMTVASRAAVLLLPYMLMFWVYTLMVFQWAALHHFGMKHREHSFTQVRGVFAASNIIVSGAIVAVVVAVASSSNSNSSTTTSSLTSRNIVQVASIIIAVITLCTSLAFLFYARIIYTDLSQSNNANSNSKQARASSSNLNSTDNSNPTNSNGNPGLRRCGNVGVQHKILAGGVIVSAMLCVEAALHISSAVSLSSSTSSLLQGDVSEVIAMVAELICLWTLVAMYHRAMAMEGRKKQQQPHKEHSKLKTEGSFVSKSIKGDPGSIQLSTKQGKKSVGESAR